MPKTPSRTDKKANTLFSYFNKTPSSVLNLNKVEDKINFSDSKKAGIAAKFSLTNDTTPESHKKTISKYFAGDLVWAKLEGHPWWPSLIYEHYKDKRIWRCNRKSVLIHVQFLGEPPQRGWVNEKFIKPFEGSDSNSGIGLRHMTLIQISNPRVKLAANQADGALSLSRDERLNTLVVCLEDPSDCEDNFKDDDDADVEDLKELSCDEMDSFEKKEREKENETPINTSIVNKRKNIKRDASSYKRRRIIIESDEEELMSDGSIEEEFKPNESDLKSSSNENDDDESSNSCNDNSDVSDSLNEESDSPVKSLKRKRPDANKNSTKKRNQTTSSNSSVKPSGVVRENNAKSALSSFKNKSKSYNFNQSSELDIDNIAKNEITLESPKVLDNSTFLTPKRINDSSLNITNSPKELQSAKSKLSAFAAKDKLSTPIPLDQSLKSIERDFSHSSLNFLLPDKIRDGEKRLRSNPEYDPKTLWVPEDFLSKQTPAIKQWWIMKSQYFDTILFFKMGKFYELFHMDAVIGVSELGLLFMKGGEHAHCGFPEISFGRYSDILVQKGYKVARVEQTETPDMMQERCKLTKSTRKEDKVVRREICSLQSKGTKRSSFIDGECVGSSNNYLLALKETADKFQSTFGVCFVDVTIGQFHVGQFKDDRYGSRLRTMLSHYTPVQVLYERGKLTEKTKCIFNSILSSVSKEGLQTGTEFWDATKTLKTLQYSGYFVDEDNLNSEPKWPECLQQMKSKDDPLGQTASPMWSLGLSSLGAIVWYLKYCLMDQEILSLKNFCTYTPVDEYSKVERKNNDTKLFINNNKINAPKLTEHSLLCSTQPNAVNNILNCPINMVLDGVTLLNLDVLVNSNNGTLEGTLLRRLDYCKTSFGKRKLKQWICSPLFNIDQIEDRQNAIDELLSCPHVTAQVCPLMSKLPDFERLLNKIHTLGSSKRSKEHPDSRAIFFEDLIYSKRKIEDFLTTIDGFKTVILIVSKFEEAASNFKSKLLKLIITHEPSGKFPNLSKNLEFFDSAFDHEKAKLLGVINPKKGVNLDYDQAMGDLRRIEQELQDSLDRLKKQLNCKTLTYFGTAKNRYQIEVPENIAKKVPYDYEVTSQRKGFRRYQCNEVKELFKELMLAEDRRDAAQRDTMRCIFNQFDKHYNQWIEVVSYLSALDVLMSFASFSSIGGHKVMCKPKFISLERGSPCISIKEGCHPCIMSGNSFGGGDFIPNDISIGGKIDNNNFVYDDQIEINRKMIDQSLNERARVVLVTGPNMGGKSTLMRQIGLICILAQLGCHVPADSCTLSPIDRIFTRLGASDHIMSGESTFFVELSETSSILQHASSHSLVLLDELGRGTATFDGNAIASAVLEELTDNIGCRTLFSTHYHSLVDQFSSNPKVELGHMACMVEEDVNDPSEETITFLYKFAKGACPKSYGFNASKLAGLPLQVIKQAQKKAYEFEESVKLTKLFSQLLNVTRNDVESKLRIIKQNLSFIKN